MNYIASFLKVKGNSTIYKVNSIIWKFLLRLLGCRVGSNFYIEGNIKLKLLSNLSSSGLEIGNNVQILGDIDLRTRESGLISILDDVRIDDNVRIVAAQKATVTIYPGTRVACRCIINAGESVTIYDNVLIGPNCVIQASNHGIALGKNIIDQSHVHEPITIQRASWLAANVVVLPGVNIGEGSVVGAGAIVTRNTPDFSVSVGVPAQVIRNRF